jgi:hypothetical protein
VAQLEEQLRPTSAPLRVREDTRKERRKRHRSPSEDTSSEGISKRRRHYGIKPKEPSVYTAKNLRKYNEWLLSLKNVFNIIHYKYRRSADKVAYTQ